MSISTTRNYVVKNNKIYFFAAAAVLALLSACGGPPKDDPTAVRDRAIERWNLLIAGKADKAYEFLSPGYRQTVKQEDYQHKVAAGVVKWQSVAPIEAKCDGETCLVRLMIKSTLNLPQAAHEAKLETPIKENWVKVSGEWYFLPDTGIDHGPKLPSDATPANGS